MSVIWEVAPSGKILNTWFGRTILRSRYELNYPQAQRIIDSDEEEKANFSNTEYKNVRQALLTLMKFYRGIKVYYTITTLY